MDVYGSPHCIFLFLLLFPGLVLQEEDWVGTLVGVPGTLLVWLFATYLTFRKRERPPRSPSWRGPEGRRYAQLSVGARPTITICMVIAYSNWGNVSRIGVIGPVGPDYFAENVGDALQRLGHVVTQLGAAHPRGRSRLVDRAAGLAARPCHAWMNVPRTGSYGPRSAPTARSSSTWTRSSCPAW